ncbi:MAG: hypothetical protein N3A66_08795, partial [Planctomycetota bacterium]|nr:hypothetical protein [Planctomycetota bacterium]
MQIIALFAVVAMLAAMPGAAAETKASLEELKKKAERYEPAPLPDGTRYINLGKAIKEIAGDPAGLDAETLKSLLAAIAGRVPEGGAIYFSPDLPDIKGDLDLRHLPDGVAIQMEKGRAIIGGQKDLAIFGGSFVVKPGLGKNEPLRNLIALYSHCGLIEGDVLDSAFIASVNGWAVNGFRAAARIDNTLFLWFSINWPFANYNAHLKDPDPEWWKKNVQCHFDLKGSGKNTRVYLMIETNYGNPGTGVWLENCDGLAMYHGATERGSSQG